MAINDKLIDQAFSDLKSVCGGVRNDYFGLLYLEHEHELPREKGVNQVAFGGNDYGLDGFHFDREKKNLYLYQFKYSDYAATNCSGGSCNRSLSCRPLGATSGPPWRASATTSGPRGRSPAKRCRCRAWRPRRKARTSDGQVQ